MKIDISSKQLDVVCKILDAHVPGIDVRVFGSRITRGAHPGSDLDLVIMGQERLPFEILSSLRQALEDSNLPFRVDLLDWHRIPESFQKNIEQFYQVIRKG